MTLEYRIGDVFERLAEIPDRSVDLIVTSPPFLALRSYLPSDHPHKGKEIGSEATPAAFIDTLLALTAEWGRVLAPHGSLCVELGDTYSGSGGAGGDYNDGGLRDGAPRFNGAAAKARAHAQKERTRNPDPTWPLSKSLTGIPEAYMLALAYGINPLTAQASKAGRWRVRNQIVWARPNPPVGALGDKFRPATSYITVACRGAKRYFDLDAVREIHVDSRGRSSVSRDGETMTNTKSGQNGYSGFGRDVETVTSNPAGAPPLDWHADHHPEDGDWLWKLSTQPYAGSHYATFPMALPKRLIEAMCPLRVCRVCGKPSERIVEPSATYASYLGEGWGDENNSGALGNKRNAAGKERTVALKRGGGGTNTGMCAQYDTLGWSDCDCHSGCSCERCRETPPLMSKWRTGIVLDPFAGSGTTLEAAQAVGRHAIGIDLDARNGWLARERVGMFMDVIEGVA